MKQEVIPNKMTMVTNPGNQGWRVSFTSPTVWVELGRVARISQSLGSGTLQQLASLTKEGISLS